MQPSKRKKTKTRNITDENIEEYNLLKEELNQITQERLKGFIIRSKTQPTEESEKPSSYFLNLEESNYVNKTMNKSQTSSGHVLEDQNKILNGVKNFYQQLYTSPNAETQEDYTIETGTYPTLTETESNNLERPIDYAEITKNLKKHE